jgi:hypothetical protein
MSNGSKHLYSSKDKENPEGTGRMHNGFVSLTGENQQVGQGKGIRTKCNLKEMALAIARYEWPD